MCVHAREYVAVCVILCWCFKATKCGSDMVRRSKIHLVDLAGSERVYKTNVNGQVRNVCMHAGMR